MQRHSLSLGLNRGEDGSRAYDGFHRRRPRHRRDHIASVDMVRGGGITNAMDTLVRPGKPIPPGASAISQRIRRGSPSGAKGSELPVLV